MVIPLLAGGFATYYISTVWDLPWEAKANGMVLGGLLLVLVTIFVLDTVNSVYRKTASLSLRRLVEPRQFQGKRLGLVALMIAFIVLIPYLGFTLTMFTFLLLAMLVLGVRSVRRLISVAGIAALVGYLMFIALLNTPFPHGPVEALLGRIF
ncbi:MAG: tripartite tricarboxylate transporter TctB family protein [Polaromonas sp.]|nr:tripartite tricarboxylate transporter TctB family protein [Polaromonas sp.]